MLGFLFGVAVIAAGFVFDLPRAVGLILIVLIFGGWLLFAIRDRRKGSA